MLNSAFLQKWKIELGPKTIKCAMSSVISKQRGQAGEAFAVDAVSDECRMPDAFLTRSSN